MGKLVLLRHGQSAWNLENRFTGWTDVDLSDHGMTEAHNAEGLLRAEGYQFPVVVVTDPRALKKIDQGSYLLRKCNLSSKIRGF